jgi:hypothetical protein
MPVQLAVTCDGPGCGAHFDGDFLVAEDSTHGERIRLVLDYAEQHGWHVTWHEPVWDSVTYCPACRRAGAGADPPGHQPGTGEPDPT